MTRLASIALLGLLLGAAPAWARGGGGCLEEGTPILTPAGPVGIETLTPGDAVFAVERGELVPARVQACHRVQPEHYLALRVAGRTLHVTAEHPMQIEPGVFRAAQSLRIGDSLWCWNGTALTRVKIDAIHAIRATRPAYNLTVRPGATYLAADMAVHNKGGGCFLAGTPVLRDDGTTLPIEKVEAGDRLRAFTGDGTVVTTTVRRVFTHRVDEYAVVTTPSAVLRVTREHPFFVGAGTFKALEALAEGDQVYLHDDTRLRAEPIERIEWIRGRVQVYNLETDAPHTYFAGSVAVHNKGGGCFLAGTPVLLSDGTTSAIEKIRVGDRLRAFTGDGTTVNTTVRLVFTHVVDEHAVLKTPGAVLRVTREHPFFVGDGTFKALEALAEGDSVYLHDDTRLRAERIERIAWVRGRVQVYNLQTDAPHTYFAGGVAVHNKGGGGGGRSGGGGGRSGGGGGAGTGAFIGGTRRHTSHTTHTSGTGNPQDPNAPPQEPEPDYTWAWLLGGVGLFAGVPAAYLLWSAARKSSSFGGVELDYVFDAAVVNERAARTRKLLEFLARDDDAYEPEALTAHAREVFEHVQKWWEARDYGPMKSELMPPLFEEHAGQLKAMRRSNEINRIENLEIEQVAVVHVRFTKRLDQREFTAIITAKARDYYVDARTNAFLRGDRVAARFQEFWTFQRQGKRWLLRDIEQSRDSDLLSEESVVETLSPEMLKEVYGETAGSKGAVGPWLETAAVMKETRIERLLNFLARRDPLWERRGILERAREVFLEVYFAQETAEPESVSEDLLLPDMAEDLRKQIRKRRDDGLSIEFRNLCIRKIEIILVRNYMQDDSDEFTARIRAHAQKIISRGDTVVSKDADVTPFEQYWTFGRAGSVWKLKDILPPARGRPLVDQENVDEESTPEQLEWFYSQAHA